MQRNRLRWRVDSHADIGVGYGRQLGLSNPDMRVEMRPSDAHGEQQSRGGNNGDTYGGLQKCVQAKGGYATCCRCEIVHVRRQNPARVTLKLSCVLMKSSPFDDKSEQLLL